MTRDEYLALPHVQGFTHWLIALVQAPAGSMTLSYRPHRAVNGDVAFERFVHAYQRYEFAGSTLAETQAVLEPLAADMRRALRNRDETQALLTCLRTLVWGRVSNDTTVEWLLDSAAGGLLCEHLERGTRALLRRDDGKLALFDGTLRSDSASTKLHAMVDGRSVIYDNRVAGALARLIIAYLLERDETSVPAGLDFVVDRSRNPGDGTFEFPRRVAGDAGLAVHARSNLRANWLLGSVASAPGVAAAFGVGGPVEAVRAIEAALFMIAPGIDRLTFHHRPDGDVGTRARAVTELPGEGEADAVRRGEGRTYARNIAYRFVLTPAGMTLHRENGTADEFPGDEILDVVRRLADEFGTGPEGRWFPLANGVARVAEAEATRGLGKTIHDCVGDTTRAQAASYVAPTLVRLGILEWDGRGRGARFRVLRVPGDWGNVLARAGGDDGPRY